MPTNPDIPARIRQFIGDLREFPVPTLVQKHITYGNCYILDPDMYFQLKSHVATKFGVHPTEVLVVGSGKLGFSIVHDKRYRPFGDSSDIDVAIISSGFFDRIWIDVFDSWRAGGYWPGQRDFESYLFRGWLRPDKLPPERTFERCREWWEFFRELTSSGTYGPYKLRAGLYKSWHFMESYHALCIRECQDHIRGEV